MKIIIAASNMVHINNFHREYIDYFKKEGNEVLVLASGEGADLNVPFKKRAFSVKNALLSLKIRKIIKREKPDVIYLHTSLCAFWVRIALKGMKKRPLVVNTVHGYLFGNGYGKLHNKIYLSCEKILKKQVPANAHARRAGAKVHDGCVKIKCAHVLRIFGGKINGKQTAAAHANGHARGGKAVLLL